MTDPEKLDELEARLRAVESSSTRSEVSTNWHRNPDGPEAADAIRTLRERNAALVEGLEWIMVGGDHLALLIGADHPPYTAEPDEALAHYGSYGAYEIWCCWRSIMSARHLIEGTDNG